MGMSNCIALFALLPIIAIVSISGCTGNNLSSSNESLVFGCGEQHTDLEYEIDNDWDKAYSYIKSGNMTQINSSISHQLSEIIMDATENNIFHNPPDNFCEEKMKEYRDIQIEAVKKNDLSVCQGLPENVTFLFFTCEGDFTTNYEKSLIQKYTGITPEEYTLNSCKWYEFGRGERSIELRGTFIDGRQFEYQYNDDYGKPDICFSMKTEDSGTKFQEVQNKICNDINNSIARDKCLSGNFSEINQNRSLIAIQPYTTSCNDFNCEYSAEKWPWLTDCYKPDKYSNVTIPVKNVCQAAVLYSRMLSAQGNKKQ